MNIKACFINNDRRYTFENISEIDWTNTRQSIALLKGDRRFVQVLINSDSIANCSVNANCADDDITIIPHRIGETQAFIGHAGWYARNPKGILPNGPKKTVGDILYNDNTLSLNENQMASCWLEVVTGNNAKPWKQSVEISISSKTEKLSCLTFDIEVLDMQMIAPKDYYFKPEYWQYPFSVSDYYCVKDFSQEHIDILNAQQQFYKDLGGTGIVASIVEEAWGGQTYSSKSVKYPSMIKWTQNANGNMTYDYSVFDKWVEINQKLGIDDKIICYSMMNWGNFITFTDKKGKIKRIKVSPLNKFKFRKYWGHFLTNFISHLDKKNIFEKVYMGFDERVNMLGVLKFIASFKNKDGKSFKTSAAFNHFITNRKCFDILDRASVGLDEARDNITDFYDASLSRVKLGRDTSIYTATDHYPNSFALSMPCESYWTILFAYSCGANGFLRWAYDAWVQNPLEDTTHCSFPAGDCFLVYPSPKDSGDKKPLWSTRLARLDDGVRDVNILDAIKKDAPQNILNRIDKLLMSIKPNYTRKILDDKSWGVSIMRAQWADDAAIKAIPADMATAKQEILSIIKQYIQWKNTEKK